MKTRQIPLPGPVVVKSNALARAAWAVHSVYEPRLVALVASQVRADDVDFCDYVISVPELTCGATDGRTRQLVSDVVDGIMSRVITLPRENGWMKCSIFSYCEYDGKKGTIKASFDPRLKPHYLQLKEKFTKYNLMEFLLLPSTYSQRLFEVLKSWDGMQDVTIPIDELHTMLGVADSLKRNFKDFRRRVLEKAHKDITEKTRLSFEWEPIKNGRAVESVRFIFSRVLAEQVVAEKQQKKSTRNNRLFRESLECYEEYEKFEVSCPQDRGKEMCELCLRLHHRPVPKKTPPVAPEPVLPDLGVGEVLSPREEALRRKRDASRLAKKKRKK